MLFASGTLFWHFLPIFCGPLVRHFLLFRAAGFVAYIALVTVTAAWLVGYASRHWGNTNPLVYVTITGTIGNHTHTHARTDAHTHNRLTAFGPGQPGSAGTRRFLDFVEQGKIMVAGAPTVWVGAIPSELPAPPPHHPTFLCRMPFLSQPSQFVLAWDSHRFVFGCIAGALAGTIGNQLEMVELCCD